MVKKHQREKQLHALTHFEKAFFLPFSVDEQLLIFEEAIWVRKMFLVVGKKKG